MAPWESWYFGRGAKPGEASPFHWTYHFSFGTQQFRDMYLSTWQLLPTNRVVGALLPNDADGQAFGQHLVPELVRGGFKVVTAAGYADGTADFSSQIARFKAAGVEILTGVPLPNDFAAFIRQAAQQGLAQRLRIVTPAKVCLFPADVRALGELGIGITTSDSWSPAYPYRSPVSGIGGQELAERYEQHARRPWTQLLGGTMSLFDVGLAALHASGSPKSRQAVAKAIANLDTPTIVGRVNFRSGPVPNVATTPLVSAQWHLPTARMGHDLEYLTVEHACDPNVHIQAKLARYRL
jgi:branched-chain amino acid transport system substrate-binding protein